jgi:hypothetical protein
MAAANGLPVEMLRHSGLKEASMSPALAAMVTLIREAKKTHSGTRH